MYHSTLILTFNDMLPQGLEQLIIMSFAIIVSAIVNANLLGNVVVLASALSKKTTIFQEKLDTVITVMKNIKLDEDRQRKIRTYIMTTHNTLDAQKEMKNFLGTLSPSLKFEVTKHIFNEMNSKSHLFRNKKGISDYLSG